jgi:hypothetical protein
MPAATTIPLAAHGVEGEATDGSSCVGGCSPVASVILARRRGWHPYPLPLDKSFECNNAWKSQSAQPCISRPRVNWTEIVREFRGPETLRDRHIDYMLRTERGSE